MAGSISAQSLAGIAFGGLRVDDATEVAILKVLEPGAIAAAIEAERQAAVQRDEVT